MIGNGDQSREGNEQKAKTSSKCTHLEILSDLTNKSLERKFADKQLGRLLVTSNFTKSDSSRPESMRLLHTTSRTSLQSTLSKKQITSKPKHLQLFYAQKI